MKEQMTKDKLIETLLTKRAEWDAMLAEIPQAWMTEPDAVGTWTIKDIIAHLTYHERWFADRLHESLRGESYVPTEMDRMDFLQRNDLIYEQNRERPLAEVLAESRKAFQRLLEGVQAQSEAFLIEPQHFEGAPGPVEVWKMLEGDVYDHYGQHLPAMRSWLAARRTR